MSLKTLLTALLTGIVLYSAVPLLTAEEPAGGQCCGYITSCPTGYECHLRPGDVCSASDEGHCVPIGE